MITKFKSKVRKVNKNLTGYFKIPSVVKNLRIGDQVQAIIKIKDKKITFFAKIIFYKGPSVYVPKNIVKENKLIGKHIVLYLSKINRFYTRIQYDGRIYVPLDVAKKFKLKQNEIIHIEGKINKKLINEFKLLKTRERKNTKEHFCAFNTKYSRKEGLFKIKRKIKTLKNKTKIYKEFTIGNLDKEHLILFYGNRVSVVVNKEIDFKKVSYYLGCYFADGTKKGNNWGICASTFEQANFYISNHRALINKPKLSMSITFTYNGNEKNLRKKLSDIWFKNTNFKVDPNKIRLIKTQIESAPNRNEYGSLVIKENRELVRIYYVRLINYLIQLIKTEKNKEVALNFICGVLEGDGNVCERDIRISTNEQEAKILTQIFYVLGFKHKGYKEGDNKYSLRIGSLEIIKNLPFLKNKIFKYHPKRRRKLIERLIQTGAARYIIGEQESTSGWIKAYLKENKILNKDYKLTRFGKEIKKCLLELKKEI